MKASAPGKLLLFGEYAVLEGAPAIVAAVDRRCTVRLMPDDEGVLCSPQIAPEQITYRRSEDGVSWCCGAELRVKLRLVEELLLATDDALQPLRAEVDTAPFFEGEAKLGLGSSAALAVAWVSATRGLDPPEQVFEEALRIHRRFQRGRGSGADVAASLRGGIITIDPGGAASHQPLELPAGVHWAAIWTGRSADTRDFLRRLGAWQEREPARYDRRLRALGDLSEAAVAAFKAADGGQVLALAEGYCDALERLGEAAEIPIVSRVHAALRARAREAGVSYKTSGAGGGDFGIALSDDPDRLRHFCAQAGTVGASRLALDIDPAGARVEADPEP